MLLQVSTGEGKSTIIAIISAICALRSKQRNIVGVVTSTAMLAEKDSHYFQKFFKLLGLTASHNDQEHINTLRATYSKCNIVYGSIREFLTHTVRDDFHNAVCDEQKMLLH